MVFRPGNVAQYTSSRWYVILCPVVTSRTLRDAFPVSTEHYQIVGYNRAQVKEAFGARQYCQKYYHDAHSGPEKQLFAQGLQVHFKTTNAGLISGKIRLCDLVTDSMKLLVKEVYCSGEIVKTLEKVHVLWQSKGSLKKLSIPRIKVSIVWSIE